MQRAHWRTAALAVAILALTLAAAVPAAAQMEMPRTSPKAKVMQKVGVTDVTIEYHRPGVKERKVWGELVPFGEVWRTGANERTTLTLSTAATVGGVEVPAGTYGLLTIPGEESWTVILSEDAEAWGSGGYDEANDAARFTVTPRKSAHTEWMEFGFENLSADSADVVLRWAELEVPFAVQVATDTVVTRGVLGTMNGAASYCAETGTCAEAALPWAEAVAAASPSFWSLRTQARLHAHLEQWSAAAEAGEAALAAIEGMPSPPPPSYVDTMKEWIAGWKEQAGS